MVAPKVIAGIAFGALALLAIAYFLGWLAPGKPAPATPEAAKAAPKPQAATVQSGVVLLPGETLVAPADPVAAPAPATAPSAPAQQKPAARPSPPRYNNPRPAVVARESPRPPPPRATRSVCVNCGVVTSIARSDYDWEVRVRLDAGGREILRFYDRPRVEVGDAVHFEEGRLVRD